MSFEQLIMNIDSPEIVEVLIKQGVDIHEENEKALRTAVLFGEIETVKLLLENGANPNKNSDEDSPLKIAKEEGYEQIVNLLLQYGAKDEEIITPVFAERKINTVQEKKGKSKIEIAREIEAQNQKKREMALLEYKNLENKKDPEKWVEKQCMNDTNLWGDEIEYRGEIVIFFFNNSEGKGECLTEKEIDSILESESKVGLWDGPPKEAGIDLNGYVSGKKIEGTSLFKLPWSGNWVTKNALEKAKNHIEEFIVLQGKKESIGSSGNEISQLHGQWGGNWGYDIDETTKNKVVFYSKNGNFQPDERYIVWDI